MRCARHGEHLRNFFVSPRLLMDSQRAPADPADTTLSARTSHLAPPFVYLERLGIDALDSFSHHASTLTTMAFLSDASASKETRVLTFGAAFSPRRERIKGHIFLMIPLAWATVQWFLHSSSLPYIDSSSRLSSIFPIDDMSTTLNQFPHTLHYLWRKLNFAGDPCYSLLMFSLINASLLHHSQQEFFIWRRRP